MHNSIPDEDTAGDDATEGGDNDDSMLEWVTMPDHISYLSPLLRGIALLHTAISFFLMVAYYFLKVLVSAQTHIHLILSS